MDTQVACRATEKLKTLLDEFVCVRAVEMEGVDLRRFQFDYDQSWTAFFLNADGTIYGRYGTRASWAADEGVDISVDGFVRALEGALEVHAAYPENKASLAGKHGPHPGAREIRSFPLFKSRFAEAPPRGCAHCHYVWEALRSVPRERRRRLHPRDRRKPPPDVPDRVARVPVPREDQGGTDLAPRRPRRPTQAAADEGALTTGIAATRAAPCARA